MAGSTSPYNTQVWCRTRQGKACGHMAMKNGRCRFHGGKSTGARTKEGKKKAARANLKHGTYSNKAMEEGQVFNELLHDSMDLLETM